MSKTSKILDQYLFAPARYLDYHGNIVDAGRIKNFISKPTTKMTVFAGVAIATGLAAADNKSLAETFLIAAGSVAISMAIINIGKSKPGIYFDTDPKKKLPLHPGVESYLTHQKKIMPLFTVTAAPMAVGISSGILYAIGVDTPVLIASGSLNATYMLTDGTAEWWRASRALSGDWNATTDKPKSQKQEAPETLRDPVLAPVPSR